ncbi:Protein C50B6.7 [Aphelenchoides avenae]|nr:Protein C50B6.7 [Aphelenchus avenae]
MVHLFEWKWTDIATECTDFLQYYGYGAVQVSPAMEHITLNENNDMPWYVRYQPVSYQLSSRSGNEQEFQQMVDTCNKVGVRIVVDVVLNHMTGLNQKKGANGIGSSGSSDFDATAGVEYFPGVPFGKDNFNDPRCDHDIQQWDYQNNATAVKECRLAKLLDLNQGDSYVRGKMLEYLNRFVDMGVAGFRFDASKHMWPEDLKNLLAGVKDLRADIFGANQRPFAVHEVIDRGGEAVHVNEYIAIGRYTNFNFGAAVSAAAKKQADFGNMVNLGPGYGYGNLGDNDVLNFIDNHDNQRDEPPYVANYKDGDNYKLAVGFMLGWTYGYARVMSSYYFNAHDQGPPHEGPETGFKTKSPTINQFTKTCNADSGWVCEHRWPEIRRMAQFRSVTAGTAAAVIRTGRNFLSFAREGKGYFALNNDGTYDYYVRDAVTTLPAGDYCDVFSGELKGNSCTGLKITVSDKGIASFDVPPNKIVAFHIDSRIGGAPQHKIPDIPSTYKKTALLLKRDTQPGQSIFLRGGNTRQGQPCESGPNQQDQDPCALPIVHVTNTSFVFTDYQEWSQSDRFLDFEGAEFTQGTHDGTSAQGTPTVYSTNDAKAPEYQPTNRYGPGYWLVELMVDCSKTQNGWFELKGFENEGVGWEKNIAQNECSGNAPFVRRPQFHSVNHVAHCGYVNVFEWNGDDCIIDSY